VEAKERRLQTWMKVWAPIFAAGGLGFYAIPGVITASMNQGARTVGLEESPVDADNLWIVLAAAYMALITAISADAKYPMGWAAFSPDNTLVVVAARGPRARHRPRRKAGGCWG